MNLTLINKKAVLSLLILGSLATSTVSLKANLFNDLLTPPSTTDLIIKYANKALKWSKKQLIASAKYIPGALVAAMVNTAVHRAADKAVDKLEELPANIKAVITGEEAGKGVYLTAAQIISLKIHIAQQEAQIEALKEQASNNAEKTINTPANTDNSGNGKASS